jgi:hypothetical protein
MERILALQTLQPIGPETILNDSEVEVMISSCSYVGCGGCSSASISGCKLDPFMIVNV